MRFSFSSVAAVAALEELCCSSVAAPFSNVKSAVGSELPHSIVVEVSYDDVALAIHGNPVRDVELCSCTDAVRKPFTSGSSENFHAAGLPRRSWSLADVCPRPTPPLSSTVRDALSPVVKCKFFWESAVFETMTELYVCSIFCPLPSHVCAETRQHFALAECSIEVAVSMFEQCVTLSLSHTLTHTHTRTHTHEDRRDARKTGEGALVDAISSCSASDVKGKVD